MATGEFLGLFLGIVAITALIFVIAIGATAALEFMERKADEPKLSKKSLEEFKKLSKEVQALREENEILKMYFEDNTTSGIANK